MHQSDTKNLPGPVGRPPLWAVALTAGLVALGFRPRLSSAVTTHPNKQSERAIPDHGRGRLASTPSEIPARGWKDILLRVYQNISEHRVMSLAAGVTFYTLLAIFPAIAAPVAIYGLFTDPATLGDKVGALSGVLLGGALDIVHDQLARVASQRGSTLGLTFIVGLAISLWSANAAMKSIFDTLNIVYSEPEKRSFVTLNAASLAFTAAGIAFVLVALAAMMALPIALKYVGLSDVAELAAQVARWPALFVVVSLALAFIYRFGPSREKPKWRWITWEARCPSVARRFGPVCLVRAEFWGATTRLRFARSRDRLHDLDLAVRDRNPNRSRARCEDGAPDRSRYYGRGS